MNWLKRTLGLSERDPIDLNSRYNSETIEVIRRVMTRSSNGVDIGAHVGAMLRPMIDVAPDGAHHAFEALPHLAALLRQRFPSVQVHQVALSDTRGPSTFEFVENAATYSGLRRRIYDDPDPIITTIPIMMSTLDDELPPKAPIAFIKLDIEGGEYHALRGATKTLWKWRPVIVFEAGPKSTGQYGVSPNDLYEFFASLSYSLSTMQRWLGSASPYTREEFENNWQNGPDYYFIAMPVDR